MKRFVLLLLLVVSVISLCGCTEDGKDNETTYTPTQAETYVITDCEVPDPLYNLDSMMEKDLGESQSNAEYSQVYAKYTDEWKKLIDEYYQALLNCDRPEWRGYYLPTIIEEQQTRWEEYAKAELEFIKDYNVCLFQTGSGAGPANAKRTCELYRERALQLYSYCKEFHLECTAP